MYCDVPFTQSQDFPSFRRPLARSPFQREAKIFSPRLDHVAFKPGPFYIWGGFTPGKLPALPNALWKFTADGAGGGTTYDRTSYWDRGKRFPLWNGIAKLFRVARTIISHICLGLLSTRS